MTDRIIDLLKISDKVAAMVLKKLQHEKGDVNVPNDSFSAIEKFFVSRVEMELLTEIDLTLEKIRINIGTIKYERNKIVAERNRHNSQLKKVADLYDRTHDIKLSNINGELKTQESLLPELHEKLNSLRQKIFTRLSDFLGDDLVVLDNENDKAGHESYVFNSLTISILPGSTPKTEIASILADFSKIYRKMGGSGINFKFDSIAIMQKEPSYES